MTDQINHGSELAKRRWRKWADASPEERARVAERAQRNGRSAAIPTKCRKCNELCP